MANPINMLIARGPTVDIGQAYLDAQANARANAQTQMAQQRFQQQQENDAEWESAVKAGDLETMYRIDPQAAQVLRQHWQEQRGQGLDVPTISRQPMKEPSIPSLPSSVQEYKYSQQNPGYQQWVDRNRQPAGAAGAEAPANQRLFEWYSALSPDQQDEYIKMIRGGAATPEGAAAIADAKTRATEQAKVDVAAQADLPRIEANADQMLQSLRALKSHPGVKFIFGAPSLVEPIPGTAQADAFAQWEQIQGKAFLEAFNTLKGAGQITEKEGEKATAAITRLSNRRQSLASAMQALKELEEVTTAAVARARRKAGQQPANPGNRPPPATGPSVEERAKGYY